jgi:ubiquitin-protein ligase
MVLLMTRQHPEAERLEKEIDLMHRGSRAVLIRSDDDSVYWAEQISSEAGRVYTLTIEYPPRFPHERPKAFFINPRVTSAPHMLSDGSLCLFDNPWSADPKCTALVVRNRAVAWLLAYEAWKVTGGEWHAPQHRGH